MDVVYLRNILFANEMLKETRVTVSTVVSGMYCSEFRPLLYYALTYYVSSPYNN